MLFNYNNNSDQSHAIFESKEANEIPNAYKGLNGH